MNKKILLLVIISMLLVGLFSGVVNAQDQPQQQQEKGLWEELKESKFLKFVFYDLSAGLASQQEEDKTTAIVFLRIIFFILVFSILFGLSELVLKSMARGPRMGIAIAFALIASIGMPREMLLTATYAWGGGLLAIFILLIMIGILWLMFYQFHEANVFNYAVKIAGFAVLAYLAGIVGATQATEAGFTNNFWDGISRFFYWAKWIFWILVFYYIAKALGAGIGGRVVARAGASKGVSRILSKIDKRLSGEKALAAEELLFLRDALDKVNETPPDKDGALRELRLARQIDQREMAVSSAIDSAERKIYGLEEGTDKKRLTKRIEKITRELEILFTRLRRIIPIAEKNVRDDDWPQAKRNITTAQRWDGLAMGLIRDLQSLERDLEKY